MVENRCFSVLGDPLETWQSVCVTLCYFIYSLTSIVIIKTQELIFLNLLKVYVYFFLCHYYLSFLTGLYIPANFATLVVCSISASSMK